MPTSTGSEASVPRAQVLLYALMMLVLGVLQSRAALDLPFYSDDFDYLAQATAAHDDLWSLFSPEYKSSGRFGTTLLVTILYALTGPEPFPFHILSVVAHAAATVVLAWTFFRLGYGINISAAAGILFLYSVPGFEVRYWLSCLSYPACLITGCASVLCFTRYHESRNIRQLIYALSSILVASTFHAGAIAFSFLAPWFAFRQQGDLVRALTSALPLISTTALFAGLIAYLYPAHMQLEAVAHATDPGQLTYTTIAGLGHAYLSAHWPTSAFARGLGTREFIAGFIVAGSIIPLWRRRMYPAVDAVVWSLLAVAVFSGYGADAYRSRYFYLSAAGVSLFIAWLIDTIMARVFRLHSTRRVAVVVGITVIIAILSHAQLGRTHAVHKAAIGRSFLTDRDQFNGLRYLSEGLRQAPDLIAPSSAIRYAKSTLTFGEDPRSVLTPVIAAHPENEALHDLTRVISFCLDGTIPPDDWVKEVAKDDSRGDEVAVALNNAALFAQSQREHTRALRFLSLALKVSPRYGSAVTNTANTLALAGRHAEAMKVYRGYFEQLGLPDPAAAPGLEAVLAETNDPLALTYYIEICRGQGELEKAGEAALQYEGNGMITAELTEELAKLQQDLLEAGSPLADRVSNWLQATRRN